MFPPSLTLARYAYLLLVLVSSLGKALRSTVPSLYHPTHRPYTTFPQEPIMAKVFEGMTKYPPPCCQAINQELATVGSGLGTCQHG